MECLGAEVTNEHHNNMYTHIFYVHDDLSLMEGLTAVQNAEKEALTNVQRKVDIFTDDSDAKKPPRRAAVKSKLGIMQKESSESLIRGSSFHGLKISRQHSAQDDLDSEQQRPSSDGGHFGSHRSMLPRTSRAVSGRRSGKGALRRQQSEGNTGVFYQGTFAEEMDAARDAARQGRSKSVLQQADTLMVNTNEEFDRESFMELRRRSLIISLEEVCTRFGVQGKVTLRVVSRRFLKDEPDSEEHTHHLRHIAAGTPVHEFARRAHGHHLPQHSKRKLSVKGKSSGNDDKTEVEGGVASIADAGADCGIEDSSSLVGGNDSVGDRMQQVLPRPSEVVVDQQRLGIRAHSGRELVETADVRGGDVVVNVDDASGGGSSPGSTTYEDSTIVET
jgi:hypothetical protein